MSDAEIEHQYAEMFAAFQQLRVSGLSIHAAEMRVAEDFGVSVDVIERVVEVHSQNTPEGE